MPNSKNGVCISNNSKVLQIAQICIEMNDNSKVLLLDAIMLTANSAPNSTKMVQIIARYALEPFVADAIVARL